VLVKQPKVVNTGQKLTRSPFPEKAKKAQVLVIDDDKEIRAAILDLLKQSGYDALEAASGQQGLELAAKHKPDLILLDSMMPGVDGWGVLHKLQADPALADTPVIVLSAIRDTDMALSLGAASVMTKPVDAPALTAEIAMQVHPLSKCFVLLVDDDADSRNLITRMLDREGWQFRTALNGHAALRVLRKGRPVMIILDLKMPAMNGFEFLEAMGKNPAWTGIPVVVVSSMDITQEMRDYLTPRVLAIMQKGKFTREELAAIVRPAVQSCALAES